MNAIKVVVNISDLPIPDMSFGADKLVNKAVKEMVSHVDLPAGTGVEVEVDGKEANVTLKIPADFLDKLSSQKGNVRVTSIDLTDN